MKLELVVLAFLEIQICSVDLTCELQNWKASSTNLLCVLVFLQNFSLFLCVQVVGPTALESQAACRCAQWCRDGWAERVGRRRRSPLGQRGSAGTGGEAAVLCSCPSREAGCSSGGACDGERETATTEK
ncbi:unnamed protein product [Urochloa humidicola]